MRKAAPRSGLVFAVVVLTAAAAQAQTNAFDGTWSARIVCAIAPDGAAGYQLDFAAQVRNGAVDGRYSNPRDGATALLTGQIQPDGSALLKVDGTTGRTEYTVGRVQPGTPYHYTANARFAGRSGSGTRNELRRCDLTFGRT